MKYPLQKIEVGDLVRINAPNHHNNRNGVVVEVCTDDNEIVYVYLDDCGHRYGVAWLEVLENDGQ